VKELDASARDETLAEFNAAGGRVMTSAKVLG
jgi:hypothetical protein